MKHFVQGTSVYIRKDPTSHKYKYIHSTNSRILSTRYSKTLKSEADSPAPRQLLATVSSFALPHYHQAAPTVSPMLPHIQLFASYSLRLGSQLHPCSQVEQSPGAASLQLWLCKGRGGLWSPSVTAL